jgi:hypothetical protein
MVSKGAREEHEEDARDNGREVLLLEGVGPVGPIVVDDAPDVPVQAFTRHAVIIQWRRKSVGPIVVGVAWSSGRPLTL